MKSDWSQKQTDGYNLRDDEVTGALGIMKELRATIAQQNADLETATKKEWDMQGKLDQQAEEIARLKTVPMKYRRMAFNAELQEENKQQAEEIKGLKTFRLNLQLENKEQAEEIARLKNESSHWRAQWEYEANRFNEQAERIKELEGDLKFSLAVQRDLQKNLTSEAMQLAAATASLASKDALLNRFVFPLTMAHLLHPHEVLRHCKEMIAAIEAHKKEQP